MTAQTRPDVSGLASRLRSKAIGLVRDLQARSHRRAHHLIWAARILAVLAALAFLCSFIGVSATTSLDSSRIRSAKGDLIVTRLPGSSVFFDSHGDSLKASRRSTARLYESGNALGPAHSLHAEIAERGGGRYSHWGDRLYFSTSDNSDPRTNGREYRVDYQLYLRPWVAFLLMLAAACAVALAFPWQRYKWESAPSTLGALAAYGLGLSQRASSKMRIWAKPAHNKANSALNTTILVIGGLACILPILALVAAFVGLATDPLTFSTKIFDLVPRNIVGHVEPQYPYLVLCVSIVGFLTSWYSKLSDRALAQTGFESKVCKTLIYSGLPLILGALLLTLASEKSGLDLAFNHNGMSLGGYIPFNDANGHWSCPIQQALTGHWMAWCDRRPLSAGLRLALTLGGGFDHEFAQLFQAGLIALALYLALIAFIAWAGPWSALAFTGLALITLRAFLPTVLSEPIGFLLGCLSLAAFILSLCRKSIVLNTLGVFLLSFALFVRMGSMFTVPAMLVWTVWRFRSEWRHAVLASIAALVAIGSVVALSDITSKLYGSTSNQVGSNFSYSLAGLSLGSTWNFAQEKYKADLAKMQSEKEVSDFLYEKAINNIESNPTVILNRLYDGEIYFATNIIDVLLSGYFRVDTDFGLSSVVGSIMVISIFLGVSFLIWYRAVQRDDWVFIGLMAASIMASAPFVIFDDGWRVLIVTNVYCAAFVAFCLKSPLTITGAPVGARPFAERSLFVLALIAFFAVLVGPWASYRLNAGYRAAVAMIPSPNDGTLLINTRLGRAGVLVTPDDERENVNVPQVTISELKTALRPIDQYQTFVEEGLPPLPYAFIRANSARLRSDDSTTYLLIGPQELITKPGFYRVSLIPMKNTNRNMMTYIYIVTRAEPVHVEK